MRKPSNYNAEKELLNLDLIKEKEWLIQNYQSFSNQTEEYINRAIKFNSQCTEIGALSQKVATK